LLFLEHRIDAVDHAILGQLRNGAHPTILRYGPAVAEVRAFRAERYAQQAGPLDALVAPPYDVIDGGARAEYLARSPYNLVHLTLPGPEDDAARDLWALASAG